MGLNLLCIGEEIGVLLRVHARDSVEQIALKPQCDRRTGRLPDGLACVVDVHFLDYLLAQLLCVGFNSNCGHEPKIEG